MAVDDTLAMPEEAPLLPVLTWLQQQGLLSDAVARSGQRAAVMRLLVELVGSGQLTQQQAAALQAFTPETVLIGPWASQRLLGKGAMGEVYLAVDMRDGNRQAAIKMLRRGGCDSELVRFDREFELLRKIDHPAICRPLDFDPGATPPWLAMEYCPGMPLDHYLQRHGPLPERVCLTIVRQLAEGMAEVDRHLGLVHRDIKPGNIMVAPVDPGRYPEVDAHIEARLIDFGLAKDVDIDLGLTQAGVMMGTPAYMATEQIVDAAQVDARADIYALGATLFHLLTGRAPFVGDSVVEVLNERNKCPLPDPRAWVPGISPPVAELVLMAMAPDREDRFLSHQAWLRAIQRCLEGSGTRRQVLRKPLCRDSSQRYGHRVASGQRSGAGPHATTQVLEPTPVTQPRLSPSASVDSDWPEGDHDQQAEPGVATTALHRLMKERRQDQRPVESRPAPIDVSAAKAVPLPQVEPLKVPLWLAIPVVCLLAMAVVATLFLLF